MTPAANPAHLWDLAPAAARALQERLATAVMRSDVLGRVHHVAGVDIGFEAAGSLTRAAIAVLAFPQLELVESSIATRPTCFPYVPGLLSFREAPAALAALDQLRQRPDLLLCDGQGIAHPRRFGLACHLGLLAGIPSIGVAKTRLIGQHADVPPQRGGWVPLHDRGETIGAVLRSRAGVKPLYVSIGHRISLETALRMVMACVTCYRLPETTRWAHRLASDPARARAPRAPCPHPPRRDAR